MLRRKVEIVLNPASGSGLSSLLVESRIKPLLLASDPSVEVHIRRTEGEGDAVRIGREICREYVSSGDTVDIVLVGGDGTTHELLNGIYLSPRVSSCEQRAGGKEKEGVGVRLALVPAGTANALFSALYPNLWTQEIQQCVASTSSIDNLSETILEVMLKSVATLAKSLSPPATVARGKETTLHVLPLMLNTLVRTNNHKEDKQLLSHLVTSHALHAAILHDADTPAMRARYAGIERFKIAAQQNATKWIGGVLTLHPRNEGGGGVLRYSASRKRFELFAEAELVLEGPFLYVNAMLTDRLESGFIPAPLSSAFGDEGGLVEGVVDVVVIRPRRDPQLSKDGGEGEEAEVKFAMTRLGDITSGMYDGGKHVNLTYGEEEDDVMVEYLRCSGYDFVPSIQKGDEEEEEEDKGRLVCTDGYISFADRVSVRRWSTDSGDGKVAPPLIWR